MAYTQYWAAAYGTDSYGTQQYACAEGDTACLTSASSTGGSVGNPNTGLFAEPMMLVPIFVGVAIAIVLAELVIRKLFRKRRATTSAN